MAKSGKKKDYIFHAGGKKIRDLTRSFFSSGKELSNTLEKYLGRKLFIPPEHNFRGLYKNLWKFEKKVRGGFSR